MLDNSFDRTYYCPMDQHWLNMGSQRQALNSGKLMAILLILLMLMIFNLSCLKTVNSDEFRYHQLARQTNLDLQREVAQKRARKAWASDDASHNRWMQFEQLEQKLIASGYLTNLSMTLAPVGSIEIQENIDKHFAEAWPRLDSLLPNDALPSQLEINVQSNTVLYEVTCPTSDVPFIKQFVLDNIFKTNSSP